MMSCRFLRIVLVLVLIIVVLVSPGLSSITAATAANRCSSWHPLTTTWNNNNEFLQQLRGGGPSEQREAEAADETEESEEAGTTDEPNILLENTTSEEQVVPRTEEEEKSIIAKDNAAVGTTDHDDEEEEGEEELAVVADSSAASIINEETSSSSDQEEDPAGNQHDKQHDKQDEEDEENIQEESQQQQQQQQQQLEETNETNHNVSVVVNGDEEDETQKQQQQQEEEGEFSKENAQQLRLKGKDLYDDGDYEKAAETFRQASLFLSSSFDSVDDNNRDEYATCRLHEALCRLKQDNYDECIDVCTEVLNLEAQVSAAIQARAHHRRAKAKLALEDSAGALQDARSAAFLGDRKAVALYGRLMRENSGSSSSGSDFDDHEGNAEAPPALLNDLFQGRNPFLPGSSESSPSSSDSSSAALMESLLNKSSPTTSNSNNPFGMLGDMSSMLGKKNPLLGNNNNNNKGGGGGSLAKSILTSLGKRLEDQSTQDRICNYLQNTDTPQVQQLSSMAGMSLSEKQASKLVSLCHAVTPTFLSKSVRNSKRIWYAVSIMRKMMQLINKYKYIIVLYVLLVWIKSAIMRPIPLSKAEKRAIREAMKTGAAAITT